MSNNERLLTRVTAPASEPVTLAEAKLYLRVDGASEDALISDLIVSARMAAEDFLRRSLITQTWKLVFNDYADDVALPMPPVVSVVSVVIRGRDDSTQTFNVGNYYLNAAKNKLVFDTTPIGFAVEITYNTGYGAAAAVPASIKYGILAHIAASYDDRTNAQIPAAAIALYAPFREVLL